MLLQGKEKSEELLLNLKKIIDKLKIQNKLLPKLVIITVGSDPASEIYVKNKISAANKIGILVEHIKYDSSVLESKLIKEIKKQNKKKETNGIIVQLPLPKTISEINISNAITPEKDVDCFTKFNIGDLFYSKDSLCSPTASGILYLLSKYEISLESKHAVIVGSSNIVGKPLALKLLLENSTVTVCHLYTQNLKEICKTADILFVAIGKPKFITKEYLKNVCVVVDIGINRKNGKIVGDVDFDNVKDLVKYITPVPGGVGPLTVAMLLYNTILLYYKQQRFSEKDIKEHVGLFI